MHDEVNDERRLWNHALGAPDAELEGHIGECAVCQRQLATLRHMARYVRTTGGVDLEPPSAFVTRLSGLMGQIRPDLVASHAPSAAMHLGQAIRRVMATLVVDTGLSAQPAGLRSAGDHGHGTRQLVFESDVADLDLEVSRQDDTDDSWIVIGQLGMDHVPPGSTVSFIPADEANALQESGSPIRVDIAVNGYFRGALPSGAWAALVEMDSAAVIFGEIRL